MTLKLLIPLLLVIIGLVFMIIGGYFLYGTWNFKKAAVKSVGAVVRIDTTLTKAKNAVYSPVISFFTNSGKEIVYDANSYSRRKYEIGEKIEVLYLESDPKEVKINTIEMIWQPPLFVMGIALTCIILGVVFYIRHHA